MLVEQARFRRRPPGRQPACHTAEASFVSTGVRIFSIVCGTNHGHDPLAGPEDLALRRRG
jgi:hypothetical protein